jgi:hypothetical protein
MAEVTTNWKFNIGDLVVMVHHQKESPPQRVGNGNVVSFGVNTSRFLPARVQCLMLESTKHCRSVGVRYQDGSQQFFNEDELKLWDPGATETP